MNMMKKIILTIFAAGIIANGAQCLLFAGDAFSSVKAAAISPDRAFDGSKSYSGKASAKSVSKSASSKSAVRESGEPKPSAWNNIKNFIKQNKSNIVASGAAGFAGYFLFGGPAGIVIGAAAMVLFLLFVNL